MRAISPGLQKLLDAPETIKGSVGARKAVSPNDLAYEINRLRRFDIEELKRLTRRAKHDTG